jgi:hypothetical protein
VLGGGIEEDEREPEHQRRQQRELERGARVDRAAFAVRLGRGEHDADQRHRHPEPLQCARALAVDHARDHRHDRAGGHDRRDDAHRPQRQRAVEREHRDRADGPGQRARDQRVGVEPADREHGEQREQPDRLPDERDEYRWMLAARATGQEVRRTPEQ